MAVTADLVRGALTAGGIDGAGLDEAILEYLCGTVDSALDEDQGDGDVIEAIAPLLEDCLDLHDDAQLKDLCTAILRGAREARAPAAPAQNGHSNGSALEHAQPNSHDGKDSLDVPILLAAGESDVPDLVVELMTAQGGGGHFGNTDNSAKFGNASIDASAPTASDLARAAAADAHGLSLAEQRQAMQAAAAAEAREAALAEEAEAELAVKKYMRARASTRNASRDVHVKNFTLLAPDGRPLLESASLRLSGGRKYGLLGQNGAGKTTLLRAISSYELVGFPEALRVVHVRQEGALELDATPLHTVLKADVSGRPAGAPSPSRAARGPPRACTHGDGACARAGKAFLAQASLVICGGWPFFAEWPSAGWGGRALRI